MDQIELDFESRSEVNLPKAGVYRYASDPSTEIMIMCWSINNGPVKTWYSPTLDEPGIYGEPYKSGPRKGQRRVIAEPIEVSHLSDDPTELFEAIERGAIIEAHNAAMERAMWEHVGVKRFGWPKVPARQWRCSAAKAAAYCWPRALEEAAIQLGTKQQKDPEGKKMIHRLCKPRKPSKDNPRKYHGSTEEFIRFGEYCADDVRTEHAVSGKLLDLPAREWELWHADQAVNHRGVAIDLELAAHCKELTVGVKKLLKDELFVLTGLRTTKGDKILTWLREEGGVDLPNMQGETIEKFIETGDLDADVKRVLLIIRECNRTTPSKFDAMLLRTQTDGRARDNLLFNAAGTGRWGGRGIQLQNLKRGGVKDMVTECNFILNCTPKDLVMVTDTPVENICDVIRGAIVPGPGKDFIVSDYAAIETRISMWLAGQEDALEVFRDPDADIYNDMASDIYGRPVFRKRSEDSIAGQLGKQAILGLGFGMGPGKFLLTCRKYKIEFTRQLIDNLISKGDQEEIADTLETGWHMYGQSAEIFKSDIKSGELVLSKFIVDKYRTKYPKIKELWSDLEDAAILAMQLKNQGRAKWVSVANGKIHYKGVGDYLCMRLPSGRHIWYPRASLAMKKTPFLDKDGKPIYQESLRYYGTDSITKQFRREWTYGGKQLENGAQGIARDIMGVALVATEKHPKYDPVLLVHDENVCEVDRGQGDKAEFDRLMCGVGPEYDGLPLKSETHILRRYQK